MNCSQRAPRKSDTTAKYGPVRKMSSMATWPITQYMRITCGAHHLEWQRACLRRTMPNEDFLTLRNSDTRRERGVHWHWAGTPTMNPPHPTPVEEWGCCV